ncbi:MAG: extracellular solute-binding protein [Alphaproteobacteria bacterium]|nr:extracellular solute-binding protein [Alphaproteobacteria bacterium]
MGEDMTAHLNIKASGLLACVAAFAFITGAQAAGWDDGGGEAWQKVLEAAKKEGPVVVLGRPDLGKPFAEGFKRDTGLSMDFLGGQTRELQSRFRREVASGNVLSDAILGGETAVDMIAPDYLMSLADKIMLPSVKDGKNWINGQIQWGDNQKTYLLIGGEYVHAWPVLNTNVIKPGDIKVWDDLLKPQYKGKIVAFDPREGAGGAAAAYIIETKGLDFFKKLYTDQQMVLARDGRQVVEWLARGSHPIALGAVPPDVEYFRNSGMKNVVVTQMEDGPGALLGGSAVLTIAKKAPHPNAAIVFLNWYASKPGQEAFSATWRTPSNRTDVEIPTVPDYVKPKPGVKYLEQYREDWWMQRRTVIEKQLEDLLGK